MTEFGHHHSTTRGAGIVMHLDSWGNGPFVIEAGGRSYRFEDSDRFGPTLVNKNGDPTKQQPGERSPFWRAHWLWSHQGRQMKPDGITCIWREPRPTIYRQVGGCKIILEHGEVDYRGNFPAELCTDK